MIYRLTYEAGARQLLKKMQPELKPAVKRAIESLRSAPYSGKELQFELRGYRSLRSRRYRIIYRVREADRVIEIHHFGPRADVYEAFLKLVRDR